MPLILWLAACEVTIPRPLEAGSHRSLDHRFLDGVRLEVDLDASELRFVDGDDVQRVNLAPPEEDPRPTKCDGSLRMEIQETRRHPRVEVALRGRAFQMGGITAGCGGEFVHVWDMGMWTAREPRIDPEAVEQLCQLASDREAWLTAHPEAAEHADPMAFAPGFWPQELLPLLDLVRPDGLQAALADAGEALPDGCVAEEVDALPLDVLTRTPRRPAPCADGQERWSDSLRGCAGPPTTTDGVTTTDGRLGPHGRVWDAEILHLVESTYDQGRLVEQWWFPTHGTYAPPARHVVYDARGYDEETRDWDIHGRRASRVTWSGPFEEGERWSWEVHQGATVVVRIAERQPWGHIDEALWIDGEQVETSHWIECGSELRRAPYSRPGDNPYCP